MSASAASAIPVVGPIYSAIKGVPKPPKPVAPAATDDAAVQQVVAEGAQRRSRARGYRSTILSKNFLSPSPPPPTSETLGA